MKEYKYKINGNVYKVAIGDIEDNIAHVEVNGTPYKVEMEKAPKVVVKPVARPAATSAPAAPATPVVKPDRCFYRQVRCKISASRCNPRYQSKCRRYSKEGTSYHHFGSHEDGKQYQC